LGFVPLLFSNLVPYVTVGAFFLLIMGLSGGATLLILPALVWLRRTRGFAAWGQTPVAVHADDAAVAIAPSREGTTA
ncbi:MAG TPA: hypothetical protein VLB27_09855, partial [candidate division Zixibacteria bacterium]|nr:hypothetical protein [candidate division Zixibacteria bacterium]